MELPQIYIQNKTDFLSIPRSRADEVFGTKHHGCFFEYVSTSVDSSLLAFHSHGRVTRYSQLTNKAPRLTQKGFTLLETMLAVSILTMVGTLLFGIDINSFERYSFRDERDQILGLIIRARSEAMNNLCLGAFCSKPLPHGVHFEAGKVTLFQGDAFDQNDQQNEVHTLSSVVIVRGAREILFQNLSGDASTTPIHSDLVISDTFGNVSTISISDVGQIDPSN